MLRFPSTVRFSFRYSISIYISQLMGFRYVDLIIDAEVSTCVRETFKNKLSHINRHLYRPAILKLKQASAS